MIQLPEHLKGIILDMDGTMFDTERIFTLGWKAVREKKKLPMPDVFLHRAIGSNKENIRDMYENTYKIGDNFDEVYSARKDFFLDYLENNGLIFKKGLCELIDYFKSTDYKIAIGSGSDRDMVLHNIKKANLGIEFDAVVSGQDAQFGKPHPDIFNEVLRRLKLSPEECIVVEDSTNGILASVAAGIPCIVIPDEIKPTSDALEKATLVKSSLLDVIDVIKDLK